MAGICRRTTQLTYVGGYVGFPDLQLAAVDPLRSLASAVAQTAPHHKPDVLLSLSFHLHHKARANTSKSD